MVESGSTEVSEVKVLTPLQSRRLADIYNRSFPDSERVPVATLLGSLGTRSHRLFTAQSDSDRSPVGFATVLEITTELMLLEYLAVDERYRSRGIGGRLLDHVMGCLQEQGYSGAFLEVEPRTSDHLEEWESRERRVEFYRRHGAVEVPCLPKYVVPNLVTGMPMEMCLLWMGLSSAQPPSGPLLKRAVTAIMIVGYGLESSSPIMKSNLSALEC